MTGLALEVEAGRSRPVRDVFALAAVSVGATLAGGLLLAWVAPHSDETLRRLVVVLLLLVLSLAVARRVGWSSLAAAGPSTWRTRRWLVVPVTLALVPLAWGWSPEPSTLLVLTVGYIATGVYEELWFRGVVLAPRSRWEREEPLPSPLPSSAPLTWRTSSSVRTPPSPRPRPSEPPPSASGTACCGYGPTPCGRWL